MTKSATQIQPTKRQRELLTFIEEFIAEHGYSPSYREIMSGKGYSSVASVALHVNSLITRGHLKKRDRSARSLEVVKDGTVVFESAEVKPGDEKWLVGQVEHFFKMAEDDKDLSERQLDQLYVLIGALRVLGLNPAAQSFMPRLSDLKQRVSGK